MRVVFALAWGIALCGDAGAAKSANPVVTESQVQHWLKTWQKRLALEDWEITAHIVPARELKPDTLGNLKWNSLTKKASIRVMDSADYDLAPEEIAGDMEYTVVHELVHLQLAAIPKLAGSKEIEERVVNGIGEALFSLEKGARYKPRIAAAHAVNKDRSASEASRAAQ